MSTRFIRSSLRLLAACAIVAVLPPTVSDRPARADDAPPAQTFGTIVSVRANILQIRPMLRHKMERVAISDKTSMLGFDNVTKAFLKPGMRIYVQGAYSESTGFQVGFIYAAEKPMDILVTKSHGLQINKQYHNASCIADLKSVKPFVFTDADGKEFTDSLGQVRAVVHLYQRSLNSLMIGTQIQAVGSRAPDGVLQASSVYPVDDFTKPGTMFAKIVSVTGNVLTVQPRYTDDPVTVTLASTCVIQRQTEIDADTVKIGDPVTFWAKFPDEQRGGKKSDGLLAIALIIGKTHYPALLADNKGSKLVTGKLVSLDPVQVAIPGGKRTAVAIPAQMPIARVSVIGGRDLKPGAEAMFLLTPNKDGTYEAKVVIVDASPWLGYGM